MNDIELTAGLPATPNYRYADVLGDRMFAAGQVPRDASDTWSLGANPRQDRQDSRP